MNNKHSLIERPDNFENRLFYQARNLAIESFMLRLENKLLRLGYTVKCEWVESYNSSPQIYINYLYDKKDDTKRGQCVLFIERETIQVFDRNNISQCYYVLKNVWIDEQWSGRQPKSVVSFRDKIKELWDHGYIEFEIEKINYPFEYKSYSSC